MDIGNGGGRDTYLVEGGHSNSLLFSPCQKIAAADPCITCKQDSKLNHRNTNLLSVDQSSNPVRILEPGPSFRK